MWDNLQKRIVGISGKTLADHPRARLSIAHVTLFLRASGVLVGWLTPSCVVLESACLTWRKDIPWSRLRALASSHAADILGNNHGGLAQVELDLYVCENGSLVDVTSPTVSRFEPSNVQWSHILQQG